MKHRYGWPNVPPGLAVTHATIDVTPDGRRYLAVTWDSGGLYGQAVTEVLQLPPAYPDREGSQ